MSITIKGEWAVLNVREWHTLYRANMLGNIERTDRSYEHWTPLMSSAARLTIWKKYTLEDRRFPWREANDVDIKIEGFERYLYPMGNLQMVGWFRCVGCGAMYTDTPETVDAMRRMGCEILSCANHRPVVVESVLKTCGKCGEEIYDTHGEIDGCPKCGGHL